MKALFLPTAYPRGAADVITPWLVELIQRLRAVGISVEVLAPSFRGLASQDVEGVRVHRFRYAPAAWETLTHEQTVPDRLRERPAYLALVPGYVLAGSLAAARLARSGEFDVLHAFWPLPHALFGMAAKRVARVPLVSTFFGVELTWLESQFPFLRPMLRQIVRGSDAVTAISSYTAAKLAGLVPGVEPVVIPFGAAVDPVNGSGSVTRQEGGSYELLFVGRLVERKGVPYLIEAVARIRHTHPVRLRIVGEGPLRAEWEANACDLGLQGVVQFDGLVSRADLEMRYRECDACVLPAVFDAKGDTEGLGVVLLEALSYGKPVIASGVGGIPDIVRHEQTGLLVPPADAEALAEAIRRYIEEPELAATLAERGRRHVEQNFSWPAIVERLAVLYHEVTHSVPAA